jgi:octaheme c-type cytochrome (tetrathionate reductase family)
MNMKPFKPSSGKQQVFLVLILATFLGLLLVLGYTVFASPEASVKLVPNHIYPQWEADEKKITLVAYIEKVKDEVPVERNLRLKQMNFGVDDITEPTFYLKSSTHSTDVFKPVRFMMREHALRENSDCAYCHHKTPDRPATDEKDARLMETTECEACHQGTAPITSTEDRLSLKAALHQKCIDCHQERGGGKAPIYCGGCHRRNIPEHEKLFTVIGDAEKVTPMQVTRLCLECHEHAGEEMLKSVHFNWGGPVSKWTVTQNNAVSTGKEINAINNNCISPFGDWGHCRKCHVGYGSREAEKGFEKKLENIDCLVCHAEEDTYGKDKFGMPAADVDLVWAAGLVGATSRATCGACHFDAGGGNARKGTLYNALNHPDKSMDVHMGGGFDMRCASCHKGRQHRIPGRHSSIGVDEGIVECTDCHSQTPHAGNPVAKHMDRHVSHIKCATCHVPAIGREQYTRHFWDWRDVGKKGDEIIENEAGKPLYLPDEGTFRWGKSITPLYDWDNGFTKRYLIGDKIKDMQAVVAIGKNLGSRMDPASKIGPFKVFQGWQPADTKYKYLAVPQLTGEQGVWERKEWKIALELGMKDVDLPFSGEFTFVETELRFRPRHEVAPKEQALTCVQCHSSALKDEAETTKTCANCHSKSKEKEVMAILEKGRDKKTDYLAWETLGYTEDPIVSGGRFKP